LAVNYIPQDLLTKFEFHSYGHALEILGQSFPFDLEWNSKDQTFDRDLLAMRTYFDCGLIDVGIIVTRSEELNDVFRQIIDDSGKSILRKYGASTTWMNKLLYRLDSRRNGGCPIMAIGIKRACVKGDFND
jgi:restriction endonuclease bglII